MKRYKRGYQKAGLIWTLGALSILCGGIAIANPSSQKDADNAQARQILQHMLEAGDKLPMAGVQSTTILRNGREFSSQQSIVRNGKAIRMEYLQPPRLKGEIIVDNGREFWHYFPAAHRLEVGPSRIHRLEMHIPQVLKQVEHGSLNMQITGQAAVAGRQCSIVQVSPSNSTPGPVRRLWIDEATGAQLGIEQYDAQGRRRSFSYFTNITYNPAIDKNTFCAPQVPADVTVSAAEIAKPLLNIADAQAQAGFTIIQPGYLPEGFRFQSASVSKMRGKNIVGLRYMNGINVISLFETPAAAANQGNQIREPRSGVFLTKRAGMRIILIGNFPLDEMNRILNSLPP